MAIDYAVKYPELQNLVDERFQEVAKSQAIVNDAFDFTGGKSVKVYTISTAAMNDYQRTGTWRYGQVEDLDATTQELLLTQDKSFTFAIDRMDNDEVKGALEAGKALDRQIREQVVPMIDKYRFDVAAANAGTVEVSALDAENVFEAVLDATAALDNAEVPADGRKLVVTPATYKLLKASKDVILETEIGQDARNRGVVALLDGMEVISVPAGRFDSADFGFMVAHPVAIPAPVKLAEYRIHEDAPGISGSLVEGRIYFDAFVLDNKADAIYVHNNASGV